MTVDLPIPSHHGPGLGSWPPHRGDQLELDVLSPPYPGPCVLAWKLSSLLVGAWLVSGCFRMEDLLLSAFETKRKPIYIARN